MHLNEVILPVQMASWYIRKPKMRHFDNPNGVIRQPSGDAAPRFRIIFSSRFVWKSSLNEVDHSIPFEVLTIMYFMWRRRHSGKKVLHYCNRQNLVIYKTSNLHIHVIYHTGTPFAVSSMRARKMCTFFSIPECEEWYFWAYNIALNKILQGGDYKMP